MNCASKDVSNITKDIQIFAAETTIKIESLNSQVENVVATCSTITNRIELLEATVEFLKQDQLNNKLCISGIPPDFVKNNNSAAAVLAIAKALGVDMSHHDFTSYIVAKDKKIPST